MILPQDTTLRLGFFFGVLALMAALEALWPRRQRSIGRRLRWPNNIAIAVLDAGLTHLLLPGAAVMLAVAAARGGWGLIPVLGLSGWPALLAGLLVLDMAIYLQHVVFHAVPALWRLHRMHHADLDFDVTTGARFHPLEILLSLAVKLMVVAAFGAPPEAVLIFEILLNATAMFNHANLRLPIGLDRALRLFVVTPDMHRVHHSIVPAETNSNFGFNLPWWDRLFGTYRAQPSAGHEGMTIGIAQFRAPRELWLDRMLTQPFRGDVGGYPINRPRVAP